MSFLYDIMPAFAPSELMTRAHNVAGEIYLLPIGLFLAACYLALEVQEESGDKSTDKTKAPVIILTTLTAIALHGKCYHGELHHASNVVIELLPVVAFMFCLVRQLKAEMKPLVSSA